MSVDQSCGTGLEESWPGPPGWLPELPPDLAEFEEAVEDSLFEAEACGDPGFADRVFGSWRYDDGRTLEPGWEPADPVETMGLAGWLQHSAVAANQANARLLAAVHRAGHAQELQDSAGRPQRDRFALDEVGAALRCSRSKAAVWMNLAEAVIDRFPRLHKAMAEGWLDVAKTQVIVETLRDAPRDLAAMALAEVLPRVGEWANRELADRLDLAVGQLDPGWFARREQAARARARVEWSRNPAGTGDVALRDVGAPAVAAITARVDALAEPLRCAARAQGLALGLPALRALACQRLLEGAYVGLDDDALIDALTAELPAWHTEITGTPPPDGPPDSPPDDGGPDDGGPDDGGPDDDGPPDSPDDGGPDDNGPEDHGPDDGDEGPDSPHRSAVPPVGRVGTREVRVRLSTALGFDDVPADLPGTGPLPAHRARQLLSGLRRGDVPTEWRVVLVDGDGRLEYVLLAHPDPPRRRRPPGPPGRQARGMVIVELAAPTAMLRALDPERHAGWEGLIRRARSLLAGLAAGGAEVGGELHPATTIADACKRFPAATLARFVRVRDRSCIGPMCSGTAHSAEIDHTRDWAEHGPTVAANLGSPCAHCHRLKHEGGWRLTQPVPGRFVWRSPLGATYAVASRPALEPALAPSPRADGLRRRVHGIPRPPRALSSGWVDRRARVIDSDDVIPDAPRRSHPR